MGLFSRSPGAMDHNRHSAGTTSTVNEPGYNNRANEPGFNHGVNEPGYNDRTNEPGYNSRVNDRGYNDGFNDRGFINRANDHGRNDGVNDRGYNDRTNDRGYNDRTNDRSYNDRINDRGYNDRTHDRGYDDRVNDRGYNDRFNDRGYHNRDNDRGYNRGGRLRGGFFSRRTGRSHAGKGHKERRGLFDIESGYYNRRPSFGTWLKYTWLDILTMVAMGAIGLGVYEANPAPSRSFPVTFSDGEIVYPQFAYPLRHEIVPIWLAALLASLIPIFIILCMQFRIRSFWDVNNAVIGLLYSLIGAAVFQVFVKWLIGGLRPHFLDVCQPDLSKVLEGGNGYQNIMFTSDICTGDRNQINDSLESMPSGHSTAAWAGFLYLYFYLNGKMKVFSNHHPAMWKLIALYAPVLGATLITGTLTIDEFHNWYDCLAGAIIGSVFAISAYRMVYASVWDFRFNHIPLTRHTPFSYGAGQAGAGGFETAVFTRAGGWGYEEAYGGAPFDSAFSLRGSGGGGAVMSNEHTTGLGAKNTGHRVGDVEHNAAVGYGHDKHHHDHSLGHNQRHHDHNLGHDQRHHDHHIGRDQRKSDQDLGVSQDYNDGGRHHHGLGRHQDHNQGLNPNSSSYTAPSGITQPATAHDNTLTNRDGGVVSDTNDLARDGRTSNIDDNRNDSRNRLNRKSLERKAIGNTSGRNDGVY